MVSKVTVMAVVLSLAIMPWFQGGRDPVGWMMLWGVALLGSFILWRSDTKVTLGRIGLIWAAFAGWTALSLIWTVNRYQTVTTLLLYLLVGIVFILAAGVRSNRQAERVLTWAYIMIGSLASLIGLVFFITNIYNRATSTFYLPNPFAGFLLPLIVIALWQFSRRGKLYDAAIAAFNLGLLVLSDSRGAILSLLVVLGLWLWSESKLAAQWRKLALVLVSAAVLVLAANLLRSHFTHKLTLQGARFKDLASGDSSSTSDRLYFLKSAVVIWEHYPVGGSGAGTFATMHPKYQYRVVSAGNNVHNFYVQTLSELGVVGLALLLYVLAELAFGTVRGLRADPSKLPYALGLLALLLHSGLDIDANYPVLWALGAILAGLCYLPKPSKREPVVPAAALALVGSLALALPVVWLFQNQAKAQTAKEYQQLSDYSKAASYFGAAHVRAPYDPDWLNAEGINDYVLATYGTDKAANLNRALQLAEAAGKLDPKDGQHDLLRGRVLVQQKQLAAATAAFKAAIAKDPYDQPDYYNDLASAYLRQNQVEQASRTITQVLALYPDSVLANRHDDPTVAQAVATSYVTAAEIAIIKQNIPEAKRNIAKALKLDPTNLAAAFLLKQIGG